MSGWASNIAKTSLFWAPEFTKGTGRRMSSAERAMGAGAVAGEPEETWDERMLMAISCKPEGNKATRNRAAATKARLEVPVIRKAWRGEWKPENLFPALAN
jgi:hypothetical protein